MARRMGYLNPDLAPTEKATNKDILWAAGFFEADGHLQNNGTEGAGASQVSTWPLEKLMRLFGGSVTPHGGYNPLSKQEGYQWRIYGARARGFLQTIYGLVSPRRQVQIAAVMGWKTRVAA